MLTLLRISNIALIDELEIEFGRGLNLLTGETGSGKSIIIDSLGALTGERVSSDIIKQGLDTARIEGVFTAGPEIAKILADAGIEVSEDDTEIIVRRDLSAAGKNRVLINSQLQTAGVLRRLGPYLADIHGQGEQASLYEVGSHLELLDAFAGAADERENTARAYAELARLQEELDSLRTDESEKLQLADILKYQINEIAAASLDADEEEKLEEEKRRLNNVEKLSALSSEAYSLLYDDEHSSLATLDRAERLIAELAEYDARFRGFEEQLAAARAVVDELGGAARDFSASLEFSPDRLDEIENRLAEISRLKRKYGGSVDAVLEHLRTAQQKLDGIETAEFREAELQKEVAAAEKLYGEAAGKLTSMRTSAAKRFKRSVLDELGSVAMEKSRFEVRIEKTYAPGPKGADRVEFLFSANPGEDPRPLAKVASGGEASRLMLVLRTIAHEGWSDRTAVFDEVDIGIGGRVAEAVGRKLKALAADRQVLCVTHQPQIASLADHHFVVEKTVSGGATSVTVRELSPDEKIDEIARMLAGEQITDAARDNARAMLNAV